MDLYKICLESSGNLIEKRIPESEGHCLMYSVYGYYEEDTEGVFAIRKTREEAIDALKEALSKEVMDKEIELTKLRDRLNILENISLT